MHSLHNMHETNAWWEVVSVHSLFRFQNYLKILVTFIIGRLYYHIIFRTNFIMVLALYKNQTDNLLTFFTKLRSSSYKS
jgi:hypothetical protein